MKVGNIVDGLAVTDVKRINKMNLIQFTKAVSEYIEQGYKIDVHSSRQVGALQLMVDMYKLESNVGYVGDTSTEGAGSTGFKVELEPKNPVEIDETEYLLSSESNKERLLESVERIKAKVEEGVDGSSEETKEGDVVELEQNTPPVKKATRTKKQTT